ncbi:MAG TPA: hypothetical protein VGN63_05915 [Flavisolibacter sp.]|jgi:hypothetical protein|nr:hypothetical protein [Flavisolibacter sp.]
MQNMIMQKEKAATINAETEKNFLYHLLFIGRISLKEYMQKLRALEGAGSNN